jgi:SAM-dependent methyltransferase
LSERLLYRELAKYYDYIYHWKDYAKEASTIKEHINQHKRTDRDLLLDVDCGTGHHITYLQNTYIGTGVDISEDILKVARENVPDTDFIRVEHTR